MKEIMNMLQLIFSAIGGALGYFLGGWDGFLYALVAFVVLDYITGLMMAVLERKLSSTIGFRGIFKKVVIFALVALSHIIDEQVIHSGSAIRTAVIFFYISNEGISVLENAALIGLPVPQKIKEVLEHLRQEDNSK